MRKSQFPRVQHLPGIVGPAAIDFIPQHRMPEMFQVHPDLVRAAGMKGAFHQRPSFDLRQDAVIRPGRPSPRDDRHFLALHGMPSDRRLDDAGPPGEPTPLRT